MSNAGETYILETIKSFRGLKSTAEKAIAQITPEEMHFRPDPESNNVAILMQHMAGNMVSRFTDFLTTDGEKPWRKRDKEFEDELTSQEKLFDTWNTGWECLIQALATIKTEDLQKIVYIREEEHTVIRALQRQLVHYSYHTGQIVYICKNIRTAEFKSLSIPQKSREKNISK